jgi:hypothetical protein
MKKAIRTHRFAVFKDNRRQIALEAGKRDRPDYMRRQRFFVCPARMTRAS